MERIFLGDQGEIHKFCGMIFKIVLFVFFLRCFFLFLGYSFSEIENNTSFTNFGVLCRYQYGYLVSTLLGS